MSISDLRVYFFIALICYLSSSDPVVNRKIVEHNDTYPPFNRELIIDIDSDSIAGYAMLAAGDHPKETIILVPGYPGNDTNFDLAIDMRAEGFNVIIFNHRGAWGSQGLYSYSNCLEDIDYLIEYLSQQEVSETLHIDTGKFTLVGRSFGGGIALIQGSQNDQIKRIVALTSVNYGDLMKNYSSLDELGGFKNYMLKQVMMNHNIDLFLQELLDNQEAYDIGHYNAQLSQKDILIIEDSDKNMEWIETLNNATTVVLDSDHNFIDKREELSQIIIKWLTSEGS